MWKLRSCEVDSDSNSKSEVDDVSGNNEYRCVVDPYSSDHRVPVDTYRGRVDRGSVSASQQERAPKLCT